MKGFSILSQFKYIIFILFIVGFSSLHTNAQSPIQNQLGTNIKFTVAKDGSGNYTTVQAAINAIPNNSTTPQVIFIKKGTYTEKVEIPSTKTHLVLIGEDVASTIIAYGDYSGSGKIYNGIITYANGTAIGTSTSHTLYAAAPDFTMMNITVINTAGDVGQAVALNSNADRQFYYHCKITGHQDTYLTWAGTRYYLKDCYLEGAVDYIFGAGVALFDSCQLNSVRSATCITAASTVQNFKFGYVFQNCKITSNSGVTGVFLGRPWRPYCQVVFINSEESSVIDPAGWSKWSGNTNDQTCYYAEYKNCGPGSGTANRATWTYQLTTAQAATYTRTNIFDKNVNPTPFTANWDPNPEGDIFYNIVNNNTTPFITSACFTTVTQPPVPKKYIYNYDNSGNLSWTNTNSWTPKAVPTSIDTVIIRSGEVQIANLNQTAPVMVEPNGTLRLIASSTLNDLRLQGGMLKVSTSNPEFDLQANITVEQPSSIQAGSVPATIFGINGTIKGSANLTKTSVGILLINSDASAFKGKWIVQSGVLKIASVTGMGVCGVHVNAAARLNIQTPSTAAIYSLKIDTTGGIDLNNNLTTEVTILGSTNLLAGSFKTANYPAYIGSTGTLKVNKSILSLNGPATFCQGNSVTLASASGVAYSWLNNNTQVSTNTTYTTNTAGAYSVYVTNSSGCTVSSAPVKTTVNLIPTATITAPATSFCTGGSVVLTASTGASYKWFNGTTQVGTAATYTATTVGSYTVEVTNASGCKATSAATTITISVAPTATITTPATSFCTGGSVVLTASTSASYKWFNGSTQVGTAATYTATAAGTYTVEITNASGCKATSAVTQISVSALPTATITSPATSFCTGGSVVLTTSTSASYKWFNGTTQVGTAASYTATAAGTYTVEITNASGCKATSAVTQISVSALPTATITSPATSFCTGGSVVLTTSTSASYKWFNGTTQVGTAASYTATAAGAYTVEVTNASGCKATSAPIQISIASSVTWYADTDNDGLGDITNTVNACTKPNGYVAIAGDVCPADAGKTQAGNCGCSHTEASCLDCNGTPNGAAFIDNCSVCVGGTTGNTACVTTATVNGTSANINVVPQPFDLSTTITVDHYGMIKSFTIISASGAIVETRQGLNTTEVTLGEYIASGLYTVIITTEQGTYTTKIIKK